MYRLTYPLLLVCLFLVGCSAPSIPSIPVGPKPHYVDVTASFERQNGNPGYVSVTITVDSQTNTTAAVVLTGPGSPVTIPYNTGYVKYYLWGPTYTAGQTYTLTTQEGNTGSTTSTVVAPGNITEGANGSQTSWTYDGQVDAISVLQNSSTSYTFIATAPIVSPFPIPGYAYPSTGTYVLDTNISNSSGISKVSGNISTSGSFWVTDDLFTTITK